LIEKTITNEALTDLPLDYFKGEIVVVEDAAMIDDWVVELELNDVIGFDTESKPSFQKGQMNYIALLQFSTRTKSYLFRLNKTGLHPSLIRILSNPRILKVGVGIRDDLKGLQRLKPFKYAGFVELQDYVKVCGISDTSLKKLAGLVLGFRVSKRQRLSNWESTHLIDSQVTYAATDSWVAIELYKELTSQFPDCKVVTITK